MKQVIFSIIVCVALAGCSHLEPVPEPPEIEIQEKKVPVPCIIMIEPAESPTLPSRPAFDPDNPREWALKLVEVLELRGAITAKEVEVLRKQIEEHNKLLPLCSEID